MIANTMVVTLKALLLKKSEPFHLKLPPHINHSKKESNIKTVRLGRMSNTKVRGISWCIWSL